MEIPRGGTPARSSPASSAATASSKGLTRVPPARRRRPRMCARSLHLAGNDKPRDGRLDLSLNGAFQRPRAKDRVVADLGQVVSRRLVDLERYPSIRQAPA